MRKDDKAMKAGLWQVLGELIVDKCHANLAQIGRLLGGIRLGWLPNLLILKQNISS